jgi:hypothetical protein
MRFFLVLASFQSGAAKIGEKCEMTLEVVVVKTHAYFNFLRQDEKQG